METLAVICPYCSETVEMSLEEDVTGEMVIDCEVCCRPWRVVVHRRGRGLEAEVSRAQ